jgi:hypothetical protein
LTCPKLAAAPEIVYSPARLTTPLIKKKDGSGFREAGWDEALDLVASEFFRHREQSGAQAIAWLRGMAADWGAPWDYPNRLMHAFGSPNTITTANDDLARKIEPFAPSSSKRFEALETLAKQGIYTGLTFMPLLPGINDTVENVKAIVEQAKNAGASYVMPMFGVTLRKGSRDYLFKAFDEKFPGMKEQYQQQFGEQYECNSPQSKQLYETFYELIYKYGMTPKMKFYEPEPDTQLSLF